MTLAVDDLRRWALALTPNYVVIVRSMLWALSCMRLVVPNDAARNGVAPRPSLCPGRVERTGWRVHLAGIASGPSTFGGSEFIAASAPYVPVV